MAFLFYGYVTDQTAPSDTGAGSALGAAAVSGQGVAIFTGVSGASSGSATVTGEGIRNPEAFADGDWSVAQI